MEITVKKGDKVNTKVSIIEIKNENTKKTLSIISGNISTSSK